MSGRTGTAPARHLVPWLAAVTLLVALTGVAVAADAPDPPAEAARLAPRALLTALASAGPRLVAVGDRGIIVLSDDGGGSWRQSLAVPSQALLTGVCFFDATHGVAVGHDQLILVSADAGASWRAAHRDPAAPGPLLDVWCGTHGAAIAVGAYGAYFVSSDGGASWGAEHFSAAPPAAAAHGAHAGDDAAAGGGLHLNSIRAGTGAQLYIAGEAGHLYRSDDGGGHWRELASPYQGSFFGLLPLDAQVLLAYGLRGNLFRSEDGGASWRRLDSATVAMLDGAARLPAGGVAVAGLSGVVLLSADGGRSFTLAQQPDHTGLAAVLALGGGRLAAVGEAGARVIALPQARGGAPGGS